MHCYESWWWIFPLVCFGMMILFSFGFARRGRRGWCFSSPKRSGDRERLQKLEEEIQNLKDQFNEERLIK